MDERASGGGLWKALVGSVWQAGWTVRLTALRRVYTHTHTRHLQVTHFSSLDGVKSSLADSSIELYIPNTQRTLDGCKQPIVYHM